MIPKDFDNMCNLSIEKGENVQMYLYVSLQQFSSNQTRRHGAEYQSVGKNFMYAHCWLYVDKLFINVLWMYFVMSSIISLHLYFMNNSKLNLFFLPL